MYLKDIHPDHFHYELPRERIAKYPLEDRSSSKLLVYEKGEVKHKVFKEIAEELPVNSLLVFNDTKVIPARLIFFKESGARIEIFLLEPISPGKNMEEVMSARKNVIWKCMIGNAKKWKQESKLTLKLPGALLEAKRNGNNSVNLSWNGNLTFSEVITLAGQVPLPPYIDREPTAIDFPRYQTVYSRFEGAVAAPTAGLHFTDEIINEVEKKCRLDYLTLHVSAGTFQPIKSSAAEHPMHKEQVVISRGNLENLLKYDTVTAVGTTSMRTLESIYWYGTMILHGHTEFSVHKDIPYKKNSQKEVTKQEAVKAVLDYMKEKNLEKLPGYTELMIVPGYTFKICSQLITNFHLPGTTLMMLIGAFVGDDWKKIYDAALNNGYRFLSYGDSSILKP